MEAVREFRDTEGPAERRQTAAAGVIPAVLLRRQTNSWKGVRPGEEKWIVDLSEEAPNESTLIGAQTATPFNGSGDRICTEPGH